jgi:hypothetical protein
VPCMEASVISESGETTTSREGCSASSSVMVSWSPAPRSRSPWRQLAACSEPATDEGSLAARH